MQPANRISRGNWVLFSAICLVFLVHAFYYWEWVEDDTYISMQYAKNFANGAGLVFNLGERVEGYSNFAWVIYASLVLKFNLSPLLVLRVTAIIAGLLTLVLSWRAALILSPRAGKSALAAPLYLALTPMLSRHSTTGLETVPFAALIISGFVISTKRPTSANSGPVLLLLVLLIFMRPEGVVFALLFLIWRHLGPVLPKELSPELLADLHRNGMRAPALMWIEMIAILGVIATLLVWKWSYYGNLLPNTYYAKMTGGGRALIDGVHYSLDFLRENGGAILVGLYLANFLNKKLSMAFLLSIIIVVIQAGVVIAAGGDWMHFYRFFVPIIPLIAAGCAAGLSTILQLYQQASGSQYLVRKWPILIVLTGTMAMGFVNVYKVERATGKAVLPYVNNGSYLTDGYRQTAQWIVENTPPGSSVAVCDIGLIGFHSDRPVVDMFGLIDPQISHLDGRQHFKSDSIYILGKHPLLIVLVSSGNDNFIRIPDAEMFANPEFIKSYSLVKSIPIQFRGEIIQIYLQNRKI